MRPQADRKSRRGLFRGALEAMASSLVVATAMRASRVESATPSGKEVDLINLPVAGTGYYQARQAAAQLRLGQPLTLLREANNPYDANAIEVYAGGVKLGYVPRVQNTIIARLMDAGRSVEGRLTFIRVEEESRWVEIGMAIVRLG